MQRTITIGELPASRWKECQALRLEGLKNDSLAFGSSYEKEIKHPSAYWQELLAKSKTGSEQKIFFAFCDKKPVGLLRISFNASEKRKHVAEFTMLYVQENYRGLGISKKLFTSAFAYATKRKHIRKFLLDVTQTQKTALSLYKKLGFVIAGKLRNELCIRKKYYDMYIMEKCL